MLEVTQIQCESTPQCHKGQQKKMWYACAKEYNWNMLNGDVELPPPSKCKSETSNTPFVECEPHEKMPHVKWSAINGEESCTHFDNDCKKAIEKKLRRKNKVLEPKEWRDFVGDNPRVFRFIKLSQ